VPHKMAPTVREFSLRNFMLLIFCLLFLPASNIYFKMNLFTALQFLYSLQCYILICYILICYILICYILICYILIYTVVEMVFCLVWETLCWTSVSQEHKNCWTSKYSLTALCIHGTLRCRANTLRCRANTLRCRANTLRCRANTLRCTTPSGVEPTPSGVESTPSNS